MVDCSSGYTQKKWSYETRCGYCETKYSVEELEFSHERYTSDYGVSYKLRSFCPCCGVEKIDWGMDPPQIVVDRNRKYEKKPKKIEDAGEVSRKECCMYNTFWFGLFVGVLVSLVIYFATGHRIDFN